MSGQFLLGDSGLSGQFLLGDSGLNGQSLLGDSGLNGQSLAGDSGLNGLCQLKVVAETNELIIPAALSVGLRDKT